MTYDTIPGARAPIKAWIRGVPVEEKALQQLREAADLPFVEPHLAVMPDVHWGMGATVGSVIPTVGAIVPAAVGVDIGCGMTAVRTSLTSSSLGDNASRAFEAVSAAVPHGRTNDGGDGDAGAWDLSRGIPQATVLAWQQLEPALLPLVAKHQRFSTERGVRQLGTLGTGNHFVEVCLDEEDRVWVMLHSGSRGIGNLIGSTFIAVAKRRCEADGVALPNSDLAWLPEGTPEFDDYVSAVGWAQDYARANRDLMMRAALLALGGMLGFGDKVLATRTNVVVDCHHNYVQRETHFGREVWLTRKGAVSARDGELGIVPGSMGTRSFIVRGKGNPESFHSCSHGAGRVMSRGAAKKAISLEQHAEDTAGVACRKDAGVLDESPRAYKDVDAVMKAQEDLVEVVHELKQVVCVKG